MNTSESQLKGGLLINAQKRAAYLATPNRCLHCNAAILPRENEKPAVARKKKFCNRSCSFQHTIIIGKILPKSRRVYMPCKSCGQRPSRPSRRLCQECFDAHQVRLSGRTKAECSHREIRNHAATVVKGRPRVCVHCGYSRHAEACHLRPVADFLATATVAEINAIDNIVMLCPNCHWEFDHGLLAL
jgi:hypothetical protein